MRKIHILIKLSPLALLAAAVWNHAITGFSDDELESASSTGWYHDVKFAACLNNRVYVAFKSCIVCLDAASGKAVWEKHLK